jgi:hypothetical protein
VDEAEEHEGGGDVHRKIDGMVADDVPRSDGVVDGERQVRKGPGRANDDRPGRPKGAQVRVVEDAIVVEEERPREAVVVGGDDGRGEDEWREPRPSGRLPRSRVLLAR